MTSQVYSFRLHPAQPREAKAAEVLAAWKAAGYSARYVLTEALLALGMEPYGPEAGGKSEEIAQLAHMMEQMMARMAHAPPVVKSAVSEEPVSKPTLRGELVSSIRDNMKAGKGGRGARPVRKEAAR
jgi:hypothetical protein